MALTDSRLTSLDLAVAGMLALMVVCHLAAAWLALGWPTAVGTDVVVAAYLFLLMMRAKWRPLLARLLLLGLVAGVLELGTDAAGHWVARSLMYPPDEPLLWASPLYMPLSWALVLTQIGYLGWRLRTIGPHVSLWSAVVITGLFGAVTVPFYEEMAYYAGWWYYTPAAGIGHTPFYVVLFEGLVAAALPLLVDRLTDAGAWKVGVRGAMLGVWMPVVALLSWLIIGR